ncbi:MAG: peroxidase-related enzyme [Flavobacteriaceae bacterium]
MSWIKTIAYKEAELPLKKLYDQVSGPDGSIDNVLKIHGLRPHTLRGHLGLYKSVLHHKNNMLPLWYLEAIGVFVSHLNHCNYCVGHHLTGIQRLKSVESAERLMRAIIKECLKDYFSPKEISGLEYSRTLTLEIQQLNEKDVQQMKSAGYDDGEILEINQVVSYFNYVNRTVLGLGVSTKGDILGLSPKQNSNIDDWEHH